MPHDRHRELCARLMVPDSDRIATIWEMIADEDDAALLLAGTGTAADLAKKAGMNQDDAAARLEEMFARGAAFKKEKGGATVYSPPKHLLQFHDSSVQWKKAPKKFFDIWRAFMHEEYPAIVKTLVAAGFPAFMRVVPGLGALEQMANVEPFDDLREMVADSDSIGVVACPCRKVERNCDAPEETCIQFGRGTEYAVSRGTGREISKEEAWTILRNAEEQGLVHAVANRKKTGTFLCNCCSCCCAIMTPGIADPECRPILAPSRYTARVAPDLCVADGLCLDACPVDAITLESGDDLANVDESVCIGCGLCFNACVTGAIAMRATRPPEFVPD